MPLDRPNRGDLSESRASGEPHIMAHMKVELPSVLLYQAREDAQAAGEEGMDVSEMYTQPDTTLAGHIVHSQRSGGGSGDSRRLSTTNLESGDEHTSRR